MNFSSARAVARVAAFVLALLFAPHLVFGQPVATPKAPDSGTGIVPATNRSPVEAFRKLLMMTPAERDAYLARNYPPATRELIANKVQEYQMLPVPYGDLRLYVTELRWYLTPLLKSSSSNRDAQLAAIPEQYRDKVASRLQEWDIMPPSLKSELLEYETTMDNFVAQDSTADPALILKALPARERAALEAKLHDWQTLPPGEQKQVYACFRHFLGLSAEEQQKTLEELSQPQREETARVVEPITKWPKDQQEKYLAALEKYSKMTLQEREEFMHNAEQWHKMSEPERQACRDLVNHLQQFAVQPGSTPSPAAPH
jgi:hypothetical protein